MLFFHQLWDGVQDEDNGRLEHLQQQANVVTDASLESTRRMLSLCEEVRGCSHKGAANGKGLLMERAVQFCEMLKGREVEGKKRMPYTYA